MIRNAWSIFSFLAVVHLLALAMFVAWLWQSGRLDRERIDTVRELFSMTITDAAAAAAQAEAERLAAEQASVADARRANPPLSSAARINHMTTLEEVEQRTLRRIDQEKALLRDQLAKAQASLDQREQDLQREREAWTESIEAERERRSDAQFAKTVRQYESVRPRQGKEMLVELINAGQREQAVAYLDAMNARAASRILGEFKTDAEIQLATELLEALRMFGLPQEQGDDLEDSAHADSLADAR